jgi:Xaa-Pro aminopeptidase/Xaa-Pro dipeptidase
MFSAATYQQRRSALQQSMPDSLLLFVGNVDSPMNYHDNIFPFVQDSSFRYFFGQNQPGMAALIDTAAGTTTLFGNEPAVADIVWTGPQPTLAERAASAGISHSQPYAALEQAVAAARAAGRAVHYLAPYRGETKLELGRLLGVHPAEVAAGFSLR